MSRTGAVSVAAGAVCFTAFVGGAPLASASSPLRFFKCAFAWPSPIVSRKKRQFTWTFPFAAVSSMVSKHMPHVRSCLGRRVLPGADAAGDGGGAAGAVLPQGMMSGGAAGAVLPLGIWSGDCGFAAGAVDGG